MIVCGTPDSKVILSSTGRSSSSPYNNNTLIAPADTLIHVTSKDALVNISHAKIQNTYCGIAIESEDQTVIVNDVEITNTNVGISLRELTNSVVILDGVYLHDNHIGIAADRILPNLSQSSELVIANSVLSHNTECDFFLIPSSNVNSGSMLYINFANCTFYHSGESTSKAIQFGVPGSGNYGQVSIGFLNNIFMNTSIYFDECCPYGISCQLSNLLYNTVNQGALSNYIDADPKMILSGERIYRLTSKSPCIDAGIEVVIQDQTSYESIYESEKDPDGTDHDIGAYYFPQYNASGTISSDTAWYGKVTVTGDVAIASGADLVIDPGSEIRFNSGRKLTVYGTLDVNGLVSAPVIFTRSDPASSYWKYWYGIYIPSGGNINLDHFEMYGAEKGIYPYYGSGVISHGYLYQNYAGIAVANTNNLTVSNCTIKKGYYGFYTSASNNINVLNTTIDSCTYAVRQYITSIEFTGCNIKNSTSGGVNVLYQSNLDMDAFFEKGCEVTNNRILNNGTYGVQIATNTTVNLGTYLDIGTDIEGGFNIFTHATSANDVKNNSGSAILAQVNQWTAMNNYGTVTTTPTATSLGYNLSKPASGDAPDEMEIIFRTIYKLEHDSLYAEALTVLNTLAESSPDHPICYSVVNEMVRLYRKAGDVKGLQENLDNLIVKYPDHIVGIAALDYSIPVKTIGREYLEALGRSERLLNTYEKNGCSENQFAWALYEQGWVMQEMENQSGDLAKSIGKCSANIFAQILAKYPDTEAAAAIREMTGDPVPETESVAVPQKFALKPAYPNPFNPVTHFNYDLPERVFVRLEVYDLQGRLIETLVNATQPAGYYSITWNARNLPSGVYFYKLTAGEFTATRKCLLIK